MVTSNGSEGDPTSETKWNMGITGHLKQSFQVLGSVVIFVSKKREFSARIMNCIVLVGAPIYKAEDTTSSSDEI